MVGIVSYGFYIPKFRIKTQSIANAWDKNGQAIIDSLQIREKSIAAQDEDSLTMAFEAGLLALTQVEIDRTQINSVFFGSETPPYSVNPSSTILADILGLENDYLSYDTQFACRAGTGAIISTLKILENGKPEYGMVFAADKANAEPGDPLEFSAGSGATAFLLGNNPDEIAVEVVDSYSFSTDTPDFWRRSGRSFPAHGGRFTGEPAYFSHIYTASSTLLSRHNYHPSDFKYAVFHMPNGKFPRQVASKLGFTTEQLQTSLVVDYLGNSYSSSALMGLMPVLEKAKKDDLIFFCSYGSGAGSDSIILKVSKNLAKVKIPFQKIVKQKEYVEYFDYRRMAGTI